MQITTNLTRLVLGTFRNIPFHAHPASITYTDSHWDGAYSPLTLGKEKDKPRRGFQSITGLTQRNAHQFTHTITPMLNLSSQIITWTACMD